MGVSATIRDDDRALRRLLLWAMALGFAALLGAGIAAWSSTERTQRYAALVDHSYQVRDAIGRFQVSLEQSETARRGYLLTGNPLFRTLYQDNAGRLVAELDEIGGLTLDNPAQVDAVARVRRLLQVVQKTREQSMALVASGDRAFAVTLFAQDGSVTGMRAIRARLRVMLAAEEALLDERAADQRASVATFLSVLAAAGFLVMLVAGVSFVTIFRFTRDLGASRARLQDMNDTLEDQVVERTTDLARANEEIQRFAYIVSHDLRSPLVNVMGFTAELEAGQKVLAELVDRAEEAAPDLVTDEARFAAREDLPEAIGFIRTSTQKMDRLINAILKLSREGRRTITPERVAMAALIGGIRDTVQHRLDEIGGTVEVTGDLPTLVTDRLSIEQVFANVIENAVKYRDPKRPVRIAVSGQKQGARAVFEITDNGRGIDPRDHARVFDLFRRSGPQDQPGEGIGLAHVRALTYRLGGTIDVASELGQGATFRINLPLTIDTSGPLA
ncbi:histidine kinase [Sphingomonas sp. Leaf33]|uniref:sensor histidine kinase n=1 Tax=Sphingomonas sp. Leaf33 TaxID=1736215 RepID=UPI0006FBFFA9|nr:sensor histidine kinase [Sphingomonas sp. Leaf33]KQN25122.1 histidine kinase [Sphingomonas sp. Leaf33]